VEEEQFDDGYTPLIGSEDDEEPDDVFVNGAPFRCLCGEVDCLGLCEGPRGPEPFWVSGLGD
jgi:hypothetical protein